jgi:hypothetical protein
LDNWELFAVQGYCRKSKAAGRSNSDRSAAEISPDDRDSPVYRELSKLLQTLPPGRTCFVLVAESSEGGASVSTLARVSLGTCEGIEVTPHRLRGTIDRLPLQSRCVDIVVFAGGLINDYDVAVAAAEFGRVIKTGGHLLLDFESSRSAELILEKAFGQSAAPSKTYRTRPPKKSWVYSLPYLRNLFERAGLSVVRTEPMGVVTPWVRFVTRSLGVSIRGVRLDPIFRSLPMVGRWASGQFLVCQKNA